MQKNKLLKIVGLVVLGLFLVQVPFTFPEYYADIMLVLLGNVILVTSFRLINTTGAFNLAQMGLMGLGGYTCAIFVIDLGLSYWLAMPLAGLVTGVWGLLISYPLSKTKGFAFIIASAAAGESMRLAWRRMDFPFRGMSGITNIPAPDSILGIDFGNTIGFYLLTLVMCVLCLWIMRRVEQSRIGGTFKAIASDPDLSRSVGINSFRYRMLAYSIGAFFAGIWGSLYSARYGLVHHLMFRFERTLDLIVWVTFGGLTTFAGPIMGLTVLTWVVELLRKYEHWRPFFYGVVLILTLIFLRGGLETIPTRWRNLRAARLEARRE